MSINDLVVQWWPLLFFPIFFGFGLWQLYQAYSLLIHRTAEDISSRKSPPPAPAILLVNQLAALGFRRLGELEFRWLAARRRPHPVWEFTEGGSETLAEVSVVGDMNPVVLFTSQFLDGSQLETGFPYGMNLSKADYCSHWENTSLDLAYQYHLRLSREWQKRHGGPEKIETMQAALGLDTRRRSIYNKRKIEWSFWWLYAPIMSIGIFVPLGFYSGRFAMQLGAPSVVNPIIAVALSMAPVLWMLINYRILKARPHGS